MWGIIQRTWVDTKGLRVFYWGFGGVAGIGRKEGDSVNYVSSAALIYQGSQRRGGTERGVATGIGGGRIAGMVAGLGLFAGYIKGDVEDLSSRTTISGITIGFISVDLIFDEKIAGQVSI